MARRGNDAQREELWRQRLERWQASGQSVRAFCAAEAIQESAFYFWRRQLRPGDGRAKPSRPTKIIQRRTRPTEFVPITVTPPLALVEVRCPSGHVVAVTNADRDALRHLFAALVAEPPC